MKNARALLIAVSVVICAILLFANLAEAEGWTSLLGMWWRMCEGWMTP